VVCLSVDGKQKITVPAVQGESQGRSIRVSLYQKPGEILSLEKAAVNLYIQKPSGLLVMLAGEVEDSGKEALFTLTRESCSEAGYCRCFMQVVYEDQRDLRVNGLELFVLPCQLDEAVESSEEFTALERALAQVVLYETHVKDEENPHRTTAEQVGARPENWMPTADEVGARPVTWSPTPDEIGAVPNTRTINGRPLSSDLTLQAFDIGAVSSSSKGNPGGVAELGSAGFVPISQGGTNAGDPQSARLNLGFGSLLWSGSWSSGSITATGIQNYTMLLYDVATSSGNSNNKIIAVRTTLGSFVGVGGSINTASGNSWLLTTQCNVSDDTLSNMTTVGYSHTPGSGHGTSNNYTVTAIYGVY
jgi:hypothetical protein